MEDRSVLSRPAPDPDLLLDELDAWQGDPGRPLVFLIHGGFWRPEYDRTHLRPMGAALQAAGWSVVAPEYRRVPAAPDLMHADLARSLAGLPEQIRYDGRIILCGHSAGGHLALLAAATMAIPELVGTLALAPVADLRLAEKLHLDDGAVGDFLGVPAQTRADLDPARLAPPATPVVLVHGELDGIVPPSLSHAYRSAHPKAKVVPVAGAAHFAVIDPLSVAWPVVLRELAELARGGTA